MKTPYADEISQADYLFRDRVRERDLDNFLVEELFASPAFLSWMVSKAGNSFSAPMSQHVLLQKSPPREKDRRQTDVRIGWFDDDQTLRACVLIESKVTADFQAGQAQAYAAELAALRERLGRQAASALLVAPAARLATLAHDGSFEGEIAIEHIIEFLEKRVGETENGEIALRLRARIQLLEALCGKRASTGWVGFTIPEKRDFAEAYSALASEILPKLTVRPSTDGPKAITRIFDGLVIEGLPSPILRHEFGAGTGWKYANVQFRGMLDRLEGLRTSGLFEATPYSAEEAGQSIAIRVRTPAINPMRPFLDQRDSVEQGLLAIRDLVKWLRSKSTELAVLLKIETTRIAPVPRVPSEAEFAAELMNTYRQCEHLGYKPTGMLQMMQEHGAIVTARRLLASPPSEGFNRLALMGRLDLAIESIVQREPWRQLFTDEELNRAKRRLM
ncbi:hypothetical protein P3C58_18915 [Mesorhizobium sp. XAP10]|uniref:hypothetical protein n=1 Tax=unclassified Mesorhizobium TaxID=325217 RepID=UPI0023DF48C1|nr:MULTISPECIES: hypothetical protein [unclassified Mesorhizobium]MDF3154053.1 hypothetical protein [Mesorhizobium sp. XAP10]MDF3247178.1 hypothetical protein [Mesorhizobium sp. XAP4]